MFNDVNNPGAAGRPAVDDIFAETDKPGPNSQSDIQTHRVGLAASGDSLPSLEMGQSRNRPNYLKIIIIVIVVLAVLGGGAYFTYSQFFKTQPADNVLTTTPKNETPVVTTTIDTPKRDEGGFVNVIPSDPNNVNPGQTSSSSVEMPATTTPEVLPEATIDSDSDGLTDAEEKIAGTNLNIIDTDNDGLSDYEELKIYHSDPLKPDTDGDGYLDGAEVNGGYDPNSKGGKLPGNAAVK